MTAPPVDNTNAAVTGLDRTPKELFHCHPGLIFAQPVQIQVRLNRKPSGAQVVEIQPSKWVDRVLDVFAGVFYRDIPGSTKLFEHLQRIGFVIVRPNFEGCGKAEGDLVPTSRSHIRHRSLKQLPVGQVRCSTQEIGRDLFGGLGIALCQSELTLFDQFLEYCKRTMHHPNS